MPIFVVTIVDLARPYYSHLWKSSYTMCTLSSYIILQMISALVMVGIFNGTITLSNVTKGKGG